MKVLLLLSVLLVSCGSSKKITSADTSLASASESKICFLVMEITKSPSLGMSVVSLMKSTPVTGKLKSESFLKAQSDQFLTLQIFEQDSLTKTLTMDHPLYKNVEFVNDHNALDSKTIELDSAEFFVRVAIKEHITRLKIFETLKGKPTQELTTIPL